VFCFLGCEDRDERREEEREGSEESEDREGRKEERRRERKKRIFFNHVNFELPLTNSEKANGLKYCQTRATPWVTGK
jgi:hypothetical protein